MKKISTLYKKDAENLGRVIDEINPDNQWVLDGEGVGTRKFDGIASAIINGELYKRYDVKKGKQAPEGAIACQEPDTISGHHPHWIKCGRTNSQDKFFFEAFDNLEIKEDGTYELCGETISTERFKPKFNVEKVEGHQLIKHASIILTIPDLSFNGIKKFLEEKDIEGIVFHHPDGRMCKIRKKDFGIKR